MLLLAGTGSAAAASGDRNAEGGRYIGCGIGLGIQAHANAGLADYINAVSLASISDRVDEFNSVADLFIAPEFQVSPEWSVGLDYGLLLRSFTIAGREGFGNSEFSYTVHSPLFIVRYLIPGEGYWFRLGGGAGYQWGTLSQKLYGSQEELLFRAGGLGFKAEASGITRFESALYGTIGVDLRWGFGGSFRLASGQNAAAGAATATLGYFAVGLRFGLLIML